MQNCRGQHAGATSTSHIEVFLSDGRWFYQLLHIFQNQSCLNIAYFSKFRQPILYNLCYLITLGLFRIHNLSIEEHVIEKAHFLTNYSCSQA
jgi:hypothetical protein